MENEWDIPLGYEFFMGYAVENEWDIPLGYELFMGYAVENEYNIGIFNEYVNIYIYIFKYSWYEWLYPVGILYGI